MTSSPIFLIYNFPKQIATNCQIKVAASGFTLRASCSSIYLGLLSFQHLPSSLNKNIVKIIVTWNVSSSPQWFQINGVIISTFPDSSSKCQIFLTKKIKFLLHTSIFLCIPFIRSSFCSRDLCSSPAIFSCSASFSTQQEQTKDVIYS